MKDFSVSLEFLIQALLIFEGISLWKLSSLVTKVKPFSFLGIKSELDERWNEIKQKDKFPIWDLLYTLFVIYFIRPVCLFFNKLVWILKFTPYIFGVLIPIISSLMAIGWMSNNISINTCQGISKIIFWFMVIKLIINLVTPCINWLSVRTGSYEVPNEMIDSVER